MTGKAYYITTLADWQRHAPRFANSHFIFLDTPTSPRANNDVIPNPAPTPSVGDEGRAPGSTVSRAREISEGSAVDVPDENQKQIPRTPGRPLQEQEHGKSRPSARDDSSRGVIALVEGQGFSPARETRAQPATALPEAVADAESRERQSSNALDTPTRILVLIEADEGVHLSLEDDPAFEPLPHPLAHRPIPDAAQAALAPHGVAPGATTFDAAEALARIHPLLKHRVF